MRFRHRDRGDVRDIRQGRRIELVKIDARAGVQDGTPATVVASGLAIPLPRG
jgi:hypothetical protein